MLVQTNFGGDPARSLGVPVGRALGRDGVSADDDSPGRGDGSIMIVVATDAPLSDRNLERLAARAIVGPGRTGSAIATARATT